MSATLRITNLPDDVRQRLEARAVARGQSLNDYRSGAPDRSGSEGLRAFQLRDTVSAHDAAYVVLAEALDCPLLTRDLELARACGSTVQVEVR